MELHPDEAIFLVEIESDLSDDTARLIYADWLEERGDPRGEYLRTEVELASGDGAIENIEQAVSRLEQLKEQIDSKWLAIVSRSAIEGCHSHFLESRDCPGRWRELPLTNEPLIRICDNCRTAVQFCKSLPEGKYFIRRNSKVAVDSTCERTANDLQNLPHEGRAHGDDEDIDEAAAERLHNRILRAEAMLAKKFNDGETRSRQNWIRNWWS